MKYKTIKFEIKERIGFLTISRPEAMNALNSLVFDELDDIIAAVDENEDIDVLIVTGEGKSFVAGADIAEMSEMTKEQGTAFSQKGQNTFKSLEEIDIPVIAAVNGFALGGGMELSMACDFRIASSKAKFGQPEVNLGLIPGYNGTGRLPRLVGLADALYLLTTAEMIDAAEALRIGLVQRVYEPDQLMDKVFELAKLISSKGPTAVKKVKKVCRDGMFTDIYSAGKTESLEFGLLFGEGSEGQEGMKAFLEKRKPNWD